MVVENGKHHETYKSSCRGPKEPHARQKHAFYISSFRSPLWDLVTDEDSIKIIEAAAAAGKPIGAVCHGPCVFKNCKGPSGEHLLKGKKVTGFTNSEEEMVQLTKAVPFLLEDMLKESGGEFS